MHNSTVIIEKLMYVTKISTRRELAKALGITTKGLRIAEQKESPCFYGRVVILAEKNNIDIAWLFNIKNGSTTK